MRSIRLAAVAGVAAGAVTLAACGSSSTPAAASPSSGSASPSAPASFGGGGIKVKPATLGILDISRSSPIESLTEAAIDAAAQALGWKVVSIDAQADPQKSAQGMTSLVNQHVNGIITLTEEPGPIRAGLVQAQSRGIPVCEATGQVTPSPLYAAAYTQNEVTMGRELVDYIAKTIPNARIANLGTTLNLAGVDRQKGLEEAIAANPSAKVTGTGYPDLTNPVGGTEKTLSDILTAHPDTNAVYAVFDDMAAGSVAAVKTAGSKAKVFTYYASPPNLNLLNSNSALQALLDVNLQKTALLCVDQFLNKFQKGTPIDPNALAASGGLIYKMVVRSSSGTPVSDPFPNSAVLAPFLSKWRAEYGG